MRLFGGAEGSRTPDPHNAIVVLYQLSYDPKSNCDYSKNRPQHVKLKFVRFSLGRLYKGESYDG